MLISLILGFFQALTIAIIVAPFLAASWVLYVIGAGQRDQRPTPGMFRRDEAPAVWLCKECRVLATGPVCSKGHATMTFHRSAFVVATESKEYDPYATIPMLGVAARRDATKREGGVQ